MCMNLFVALSFAVLDGALACRLYYLGNTTDAPYVFSTRFECVCVRERKRDR